MPQFDFYSYPVQTLWTLAGFGYTYFFVTYHIIPKISEVSQMRLLFKNLDKQEAASSKSKYDRVIKAILESYK
jgi:hypothetical protein